jgi:bacteriorhodopsin
MATGSGTAYITSSVEHPDHVIIVERQIYYVRFIEWFFSTPPLLLNLGLLAGLAWFDILTMLILGELMILCALMGGMITTSW